jgi:hypothetical protein
MKRFRDKRCSEVVTAKLLSEQRAYLESQALARDVSICTVIRELIDSEMQKNQSWNLDEQK